MELSLSLESNTRTAEQQAVINQAIDLVLHKSVEYRPKSAQENNYPSIGDEVKIKAGLRQAAVILAVELDGTQNGIDRVASFYSSVSLSDSRPYSYLDELLLAHELAAKRGVSPEVGEQVLSAEVERGLAELADEMAHDQLRRDLTGEELLSLVDKYTSQPIRRRVDMDWYVSLACKNNASPEVLRQIREKVTKGKSSIYQNRESA